ncbi:11698_t:CDS:2 [Gigaspora rosea]|nr:11698_t:CDS:2 [Gigaspora rosea]
MYEKTKNNGKSQYLCNRFLKRVSLGATQISDIEFITLLDLALEKSDRGM